MGDWPELWTPGVHEWTQVLSTISPDGIVANAAGASAAWPAANLAIYVPIRVGRTCTVYKMATVCGAAGAGNFDLGVFTWGGVKLVSTGSTARVVSSKVVVDVTDTLLQPGRYWLGMSVDGTTNLMVVGAALNAGMAKIAGLRQQATAFPLPSTATFATAAQSMVPMVAAYLRSE